MSCASHMTFSIQKPNGLVMEGLKYHNTNTLTGLSIWVWTSGGRVKTGQSLRGFTVICLFFIFRQDKIKEQTANMGTKYKGYAPRNTTAKAKEHINKQDT